MQYNRRDFIIEKSDKKNKKYMAKLKGDPEGKKIYFGAIKPDGSPYFQFKDRTPLKLFKDYDHNDKERMERYIKRHQKDIIRGFNAGWLSYLFLWS